jgi:AcrR family transcriptional regulator
MPQTLRKRTRDDPEIRRKQILDEAIRIIGERGYYGFTIQELAQRCGLTNGGLLYHFGSKEQLLVAVIEARDGRARTFVNAEVEGWLQEHRWGGSTLESVFVLLRSIVSLTCSEPELTQLYMVLQSEAMDSAHPAHRYFRTREARVLKAFAEIIELHVADPQRTARQIYALMDGLEQLWLRSRQAFDLVAEWDRAVAMLLSKPSVRATKHAQGRARPKIGAGRNRKSAGGRK